MTQILFFCSHVSRILSKTLDGVRKNREDNKYQIWVKYDTQRYRRYTKDVEGARGIEEENNVCSEARTETFYTPQEG